MNKYLIFGAVVITVLVLGSFMLNKEDNTTLMKVIKEEDPILIDVRSESEWNSGHIDGTIHIPLDLIPKKIAELDSTKSVIVFCQSGVRSERAKFQFKKNGFKKVYNGGGWKNMQSILDELSK